MNTVIVDILCVLLYLFHSMIVVFTTIGPFIIPTKYLDYYVCMVIITILTWTQNDKECIVTTLQNKLEKNKYKNGFISTVLKIIVDEKKSEVIKNILEIMTILSFTYACYRLNNINYVFFMIIAWIMYKNNLKL